MSYYSDTITRDKPVVYWRLGDGLNVNQVVDGSFEVNSLVALQVNWDLGTAAEWSLDKTFGGFHAGTTAIKCTTTRVFGGGSWNDASNHVKIAITPTQTYFCSFWTKQTIGTHANHFKILWYQSNGTSLSAIRTTDFIMGGTDGDQPWTFYSGIVTPPSDAAFALLNCMAGAWDQVNGTNAQMWFDNVEFRAYSTAYEIRGNGPNGTLRGGVLTGQSSAINDPDASMLFDGSTGYVEVPDSSALNPSTISLEAWIYPTVDQLANFISKGSNNEYRIRLNGKKVNFLDRGSTNQITGSSVLPLNAWTHVVGTGDSSGLKVYINGNLDASNTVAYGGASVSNPLQIGRHETFNEWFAGKLDEVAIYNYALTLDQVRAHFNAASVLWAPSPGGVNTDPSQISTLPSTIDIAISETLPYQVDVSGYLSGNDSIGSLGSVNLALWSIATGEPVTTGWNSGVTNLSNIITTHILGSALQKGQRYQLVITFTANFQKTVTLYTNINVIA